MPIQDHTEMGFSDTNGDADFNDLIIKMNDLEYYLELFTMVCDNASITEQRMQNVMAQFIRSTQFFDSKYDTGRAEVNEDIQPFSNFTIDENTGKCCL